MVISLTTAVEGRCRVRNVEADQPVGAKLEVLEAVESWITRLPRPHSQALRLIYVDGRTQEEAAALVGCSKSNMSRLHNQGLRWLQHGHGRRDRLPVNPEAVIDACA